MILFVLIPYLQALTIDGFDEFCDFRGDMDTSIPFLLWIYAELHILHGVLIVAQPPNWWKRGNMLLIVGIGKDREA